MTFLSYTNITDFLNLKLYNIVKGPVGQSVSKKQVEQMLRLIIGTAGGEEENQLFYYIISIRSSDQEVWASNLQMFYLLNERKYSCS